LSRYEEGGPRDVRFLRNCKAIPTKDPELKMAAELPLFDAV